jgi:prepilin-type N-terminal cleavage/methylation domain-containing protein
MKIRTRQKQAGFSMLELLVSIAILTTIVGVTLKALVDAQHANEAVGLLGDMNQNLRGSLLFMSRDLTQTAEGVPQSGIPYPQGGTAKKINWPSPPGKAYTYPLAAPMPQMTTLTPLVPANSLGLTVNGATTDMISMMYVDNSLVDSNGHSLSTYPIYSAASPVCNGTIASTGLTATFDANCINITGNDGIKAGDLIMFSNSASATPVVQTVTSVSGQVVSFAAGDAFNFNGMLSAATAGTLKQLQNGATTAGGPYPATTAARVRIVSYWIDNVTNAKLPSLIRQINFNSPYVIGQGVEDLQITYGIAQPSTVGAYGTAGPGNATYPISPDTPAQIRTVNMFVAARTENPYSQNGQYFRDNMVTTVCVRSLSFVNRYP